MAKYISIQVEHPCNENWHQMKPNAEGSFCASCRKTVIDFTAMTDNQLMEYFKANPAGGCGKFSADQLENPLAIPVKKIPWLKYFFQISLPAMLIGFKANAQRVVKNYQQPVIVLRNAVAPKTTAVSGKITNIYGEPIPYASVLVKGGTMGVAADSNGLFKLQLTDTGSMLEITATGYKNKTIAVNNEQLFIQLDIALADDIRLDAVVVRSSRSNITLGGYSSRIYRSPLSGKEQKPETATVNTMTIFPNPVKKNGNITIVWKNKIRNDQLVTIYNAAGQKLQQEKIYISQPTFLCHLSLNISTAAYYILQVEDNKTHQRCSLPFVIE